MLWTNIKIFSQYKPFTHQIMLILIFNGCGLSTECKGLYIISLKYFSEISTGFEKPDEVWLCSYGEGEWEQMFQ